MAKNKASTIIDKITNAIKPSSAEDEAQASSSAARGQAETPAVQNEDAGSQRQRGPVEEVIAKRVKQLSKKIQRFQSYAAQPPASLNPDQKSAVASLPVLTAQSKELEDLIKPGGAVEVVELNEAAKLRSAKEDAERLAKGDFEAQINSNIQTISQNISLFLRLHALLHPARPADHSQLTFSPLDLPAQLQDEVQATDILRVGRMYDELSRGGEEAERVVRGLLAGSDGEDEENDHIHHLLHLLAHPTSESDPTTATATGVQDETAPSVSIPPTRPESALDSHPAEEQGQAEQITTAPASEYGHSAAQAQEPTEVIQPASGAATPAVPATGGFNFLQADELTGSSSAPAPAPEQEEKEPKVAREGLEEYEVVPAMQAHETAEYDPSPAAASTTASDPAADVSSAPAAAATPAESAHPLSRSGLLVDDSAPVNWADDDDEDESNEPIALGQASSSASTPATSVPAVPVPAQETPALGAPVQAPTSAEGGASSEAAKGSVPTGPRARGQGQGQSAGAGGRGRGARQNGAGHANANANGRRTPQNGSSGSKQQAPAAVPVPNKQGVFVDADGFETKIRTGKNALQGQQGQGQGQQGQGRPQGQRNGSGFAGRGRGRGGPPRGDTRTPPNAADRPQQGQQTQQNGGARPPRPQQARQGSNKPAAAPAGPAPATTA